MLVRTARRRILSIAALFSFVLLSSLTATVLYAVCNPNTAYVVTFSAPPPTANWTTTSGALWQPSGGFPGCSTGDSASSANLSPTTIIVNSTIPNSLAGLTFNAPGSVIQIDSGGSLTLAGSSLVTGGSKIVLNGGELVIASGGSLSLTSSNFQMNAGQLVVQSGGTLSVASGQIATVNGLVNIDGTLDVQSGATLNIGAGTTFNITGGSIGSSGGIINNSGTTYVSVSSAITSSAAFNNTASGTLEVANGTFSLSGGGTADGPITIDTGATLDFPAGSYTMNAGGTVHGDGTLSITGATVSAGGVTSPGTLLLTAGTLTGNGFLSVRNSMTWSGGTITGTGGAELAGTATGTWDGSDGAMTLDGRTFNVYGTVNYGGGGNELTLSNGATLAVFGNFNIVSDASINAGSGGGLVKISPNGFFVKSGGSGVSTISTQSQNDSSVFAASGTLNFAGDGSHSGFFSANSGATLQFSAASTTITSSGFIDINGTLLFTSGFTDISAGINDSGLFDIENGSVALHAFAGLNDFVMVDGNLTLYDEMEMVGPGTWSGGTIDGPGTFHVACCGATLVIDAANTDVTLGAELWNEGDVTYTAQSPNALYLRGAGILTENNQRVRPLFSSAAGLITNNGNFDIQTDQPILIASVFVGDQTTQPKTPARRHAAKPSGLLVSGTAAIDNMGTFQKSAGTGTTSIEPVFTNLGGTLDAKSGTMSFVANVQQNSGNIHLGGGSLTAPQFTLDGGTLTGAGTITGAIVNNSGNVSPGDSPGLITNVGNLTFGASSTYTAEIGGTTPGTLYDQLAVTGSATLDGTLDVSLINGFVPANGDSFTIMTYASHTGAFATVNLPTFAAGHGSFTVNYTPTALILTAVVTPLSSDLFPAVNGPTSVNAGAPLSYTVVVNNSGPDATTGTITVVDTLPAGVSGASGSGTGWSCGAPSGGTITCTSTTSIPPTGISSTLTFSMTAPANGGSVSNSATVSYANDGNGANNTNSASTTVVSQSDVGIAKSGPAGVTAGQNVTYTITVTNNGPSTASSVVVSDPLPPNLTFVSLTGGGCTSFPCSLGTLTNGQIVTLTATYSTSPNFSGNVTNTASVSTTTADPNSTNNSASATTNVGAQADLVISKTGPATANTGQNVTYTISVTNNGPSPAANVVISDPPPVGVAFQSATAPCAAGFPCNVGTINAGQTVSTTATYTIPGNYTGTSVSNTASVSSSTNDPNNTNNTSTATTAVGPQTDLSITKSGPTSVSPGQDIVYTIVVTNSGGTAAPNVVVTDPTPAGTTFVSNTGACATPFPCNIGTLNPNQSATITSTFNVPAGFTGTQITNTASVSSSIGDPNGTNNAASATTNVVPPTGSTPTADVAVVKGGPNQASNGETVSFVIDVRNDGPSNANNVVVTDPTPAGLTFLSNAGACTTPFPCALGTMTPGHVVRIVASYSVTATSPSTVTNTATATSSTLDPNAGNNSSTTSFPVVPGTNNNCPGPAPTAIAPAPGASVSSPVTFSWNGVNGATGYVLTIIGGGAPTTITTNNTNVTIPVPNGSFLWTVSASFSGGCPSLAFPPIAFTVCTPPGAPIASVVGESTSGQTYSVQWPGIDGVNSYELQESNDAAFSNPSTFTLNTTAKTFTKVAGNPIAIFYRVRAIACGKTGAFSPVISVVIVPLPKPGDTNINVNTPAGSTQAITFPFLIPGLPSGTTTFVVSVDKPWLAVTPTSGVVPPEGVIVTISMDPSALTNGTWTGTVIIVYGTAVGSSDRATTEVTLATKQIPVSISLVTPVAPSPLTAASGALVIPSVGHLSGVNSQWQSDVRVANVAPTTQKYQVTFNSGTGDPSIPLKQTNVTIDGGSTIALDDVVRNWFGIGSLGDSANGTMWIQLLDNAGKVLTDNSIGKSTVVTSRTYNVASAGTLGQFVPAIPFSSFIGNASSVLSLQQIAQNSAFHTNLGIAEAAGAAVDLNVNVFDAFGKQILSLPLSLKPGEQKQMNSFLETNGIASLSTGRVEVKVTGGQGKVTTYASVVDNNSTDPFLVSPVTVNGDGSNRYAILGVADLSSSIANWRTDVRIYNASPSPQTATLTFYPNGNPLANTITTVSIQPAEVKALDDILRQTFGLSNVAGTLHVTTPASAPLVVTARTFNQTANGTLGQFVTAVTPADGVGLGDKSLQILQAEESPRYRTNLGIAELTGKPVTAEVTIVLPDSRVSPRVVVPLDAFGSIQLAPIRDLGIGNIYNARLSVKVIDGAGKIAAYGSIVDQTTQAPTYVPAQ